MPIRLVVRVPRGSTVDVSEHTFTREKIVVGRSPECDLVLPGDEVRVSRKHIEVQKREGGYLLQDLGSRNGTILNDQVIKPESAHPLNETDVVKMGTVEMEVAGVILDDEERDQLGAIRKSRSTDVRAREDTHIESDPRERVALEAFKAISKQFIGADDFENDQQVRQFGELVRVALDILLEGLFRNLAARKEFEGEFDANVTMAFQRESNPIKTMEELERFKSFPLNWKEGRSVFDMKDSLERAIKDVNQHQMGLLAGMQQVLDAIVQKLDPMEIEKAAFEKSSMLGRMNKSRLAWQEYLETYSDFLAESSKLFNDVIYPNLQRGYLLSHKEKTRIMQSVDSLQKKAVEAARQAELNRVRAAESGDDSRAGDDSA